MLDFLFYALWICSILSALQPFDVVFLFLFSSKTPIIDSFVTLKINKCYYLFAFSRPNFDH